MKLLDVQEIVEGTGDAAFAVGANGVIVAWNSQATELTGLPKQTALGRPCCEVIKGVDECGPVCSDQCTVRQSISNKNPIRNFDLQIPTTRGRRWCNISVSIVGRNYAIHIVRLIDVRKRLELAMRDFIINGTQITTDQAMALVSSSTRTPIRETKMTSREREVLRLLATPAKIFEIAKKLDISRPTLHNHIQHIFRKLDVHSRMEAVRRAERAGLLR